MGTLRPPALPGKGLAPCSCSPLSGSGWNLAHSQVAAWEEGERDPCQEQAPRSRCLRSVTGGAGLSETFGGVLAIKDQTR